jgi:hypothetical protein
LLEDAFLVVRGEAKVVIFVDAFAVLEA